MLTRLQAFAIRISRTWWLYLGVVVLFVGSLTALNRIGALFQPEAGGAPPFDLQNDLAPGDVYAQLAAYMPRARELYHWFTAIDYGFPFFAGLFITATVAFGLRNGLPRLYDRLVAGRWLLLLMVPTLFDWTENVLALTTITLYPTEVPWLPGLLVTAKKCKLGSIVVSNAAMAIALLAAAFAAVNRWLQQRRRPPAPPPGT